MRSQPLIIDKREFPDGRYAVGDILGDPYAPVFFQNAIDDVYSKDEVFIEATHFMRLYEPAAQAAGTSTPHYLAMTMIQDVLRQTGITATAGIGTNLYLAKVVMNIVAKKAPADKDGVRIAELDDIPPRMQIHSPLP